LPLNRLLYPGSTEVSPAVEWVRAVPRRAPRARAATAQVRVAGFTRCSFGMQVGGKVGRILSRARRGRHTLRCGTVSIPCYSAPDQKRVDLGLEERPVGGRPGPGGFPQGRVPRSAAMRVPPLLSFELPSLRPPPNSTRRKRTG